MCGENFRRKGSHEPVYNKRHQHIPSLRTCIDTIVSYVRFISRFPPAPSATKLRIIDAAEQLFAEYSFHGVSLREITTRAGVNLAAVNYHFGDKETLFWETIIRRIRPLNAQRLSMLEEACNEAATQTPALDRILAILAQPLFDLHRSRESGCRSFVHLLARGLTDSSPLTAKLLAEEYHPTLARFGQLIRRHVPQLSPEDFLWRFSFVIGALHHTLATLHQMTELTRGICRSDDYAGALARFVGHSVAIFRAPPSSMIKPRY